MCLASFKNWANMGSLPKEESPMAPLPAKIAAMYTFSVLVALSRWNKNCKNLRTIPTEQDCGSCALSLHHATNTPHLAPYSRLVEGALAHSTVCITASSKSSSHQPGLTSGQAHSSSACGQECQTPPPP